MAEHPILFSGEMVRQLLARKKSQTRRMSERWMKVKKGDLLWVRETFCVCEGAAYGSGQSDRLALYQATYTGHSGLVFRPSIHMPRWASRITLRATADARKERLQDISEADAISEGIIKEELYPNGGFDPDNFHPPGAYGFVSGLHKFPMGRIFPKAREAYEELWDSINGKKAPWSSNPDVIVLAFEVEESRG